MMNAEQLRAAVRNRYPKFMVRGGSVSEQLVRDSHMNDVESSTDFSAVNEANVTKALDALLSETSFGDPSSVGVLMALTKAATYARVYSSLTAIFSQDVLDAILVSFINYVGISAGVDYALYTADIQK